jgi:hypothetical protein
LFDKIFFNATLKLEKIALRIQQKHTFEESLHYVNSITDGIGRPVDNKIKNLLASIIMVGVKTRQSCGGHKHPFGHTHPWIEFDSRNIQNVRRITGHQNCPKKDNGRRNYNIWVILPGFRPRIVPWDTKVSLATMQRRAEEFAMNMQKRYIRQT